MSWVDTARSYGATMIVTGDGYVRDTIGAARVTPQGVSYTDGAERQAVHLDGQSQVTIDGAPARTLSTLEVWVRSNAPTRPEQQLLRWGATGITLTINGPGSGREVGTLTGRVQHTGGTQIMQGTTRGSVCDGRWHQVVVRTESAGLFGSMLAELLVDGVSAGRGRTIGGLFQWLSYGPEDPMILGNGYGTRDVHFTGDLDSIALYPAWLSDSRVEMLRSVAMGEDTAVFSGWGVPLG